MTLRLNIWFVFLLLGLLLSYNLDLECLLDDQGVCRQVCQESVEDICAEPSFGSPPVVALPTRTFVFQSIVVEATSWSHHISRDPLPSRPPSCSSRLRAPPVFS